MIYLRLSTGFDMLVSFTDFSLMEFLVRYLALFRLFSIIGGLEWSWMVPLHKNIQLMLVFLKAPFLVLHFPYYTSMTFLMMLSVILLSLLIILLSTLSMIRHLICGNLNLTYTTLQTGAGSDLLIEKFSEGGWQKCSRFIYTFLFEYESTNGFLTFC